MFEWWFLAQRTIRGVPNTFFMRVAERPGRFNTFSGPYLENDYDDLVFIKYGKPNQTKFCEDTEP